jgi:hypothetical protein
MKFKVGDIIRYNEIIESSRFCYSIKDTKNWINGIGIFTIKCDTTGQGLISKIVCRYKNYYILKSIINGQIVYDWERIDNMYNFTRIKPK